MGLVRLHSVKKSPAAVCPIFSRSGVTGPYLTLKFFTLFRKKFSIFAQQIFKHPKIRFSPVNPQHRGGIKKFCNWKIFQKNIFIQHHLAQSFQYTIHNCNMPTVVNCNYKPQ
nr:MAG TPA: hypothetical protein [Bacteriophage sp.]